MEHSRTNYVRFAVFVHLWHSHVHSVDREDFIGWEAHGWYGQAAHFVHQLVEGMEQVNAEKTIVGQARQEFGRVDISELFNPQSQG